MAFVQSAEERCHPWSGTYLKLWLASNLVRLVARIKNPTCEEIMVKYPDITASSVLVPSREEGRDIIVRIYSPKGAKEKPPVNLNFHGSGFVIPNLGEDAPFCCELAITLGCVVVDGDYRKAPEHPFPAAVNDAEDIAKWILSQTTTYDTSQFTVTGFSAGGNLALSISSQFGPDRVRGAAIAYPVVDFDTPIKEKVPIEKTFDSGAVLSQLVLRLLMNAYTRKDQDKTDPRLSLTHAPPLTFPKHVLVIAPTGDSLYKEAKRFIEYLNKGSHPDARLWTVEHEAHGWDKQPLTTSSTERRDKAYAEMYRTLQESWGG